MGWKFPHIPARIRCWIAGVLLVPVGLVSGQSRDEAQKLFLAGEYQRCITICEKADPDGFQLESWRLLQTKALLALGRYPEAEGVISNSLVHVDNSLLLRELGLETAKRTGNLALRQKRIREINQLVSDRSWAFREPKHLLSLGRVALLLGADPKTILERLFQPARQADPDSREAWLAGGQLALDKHDFALAAKTFAEAQKKFPDDADVLCGLAQAYQSSSRSNMLFWLKTALEKNENHVPSLLGIADHLIDAEDYAEADVMVERALKVNPWHPQAWAYRAVLAHLRNDSAGETAARQKALTFWKTNPEVDHLIGQKLSQNYRFVEGAARQRRALEFEPDFLPARMQLAEDLLRLGEETEGWRLADEVHKQDAYDVTAYNLVTLHGTMEKFQTLTNENFVLRMGANEAALYGDRALALLGRAKAALTAKYGITLERPTVVEIFPEQKDFAVRTFGMPGNPGFLGVCFGRVITANSPASQGGSPANWEAVLWHEFGHVVTLQMTRNKMPRWLSEGISVYEELQANPAWGQTMNPQYREMVLGDDLTPVSKLSSAFMSPKSNLHVQFAYYQSSLVVEYLVGKFGFEKLKAILRSLGEGVAINDAITKHTAPMAQIEKEFEAFAKAKAAALGPGLDWEKPKNGAALSQLGFRSRPPRVDVGAKPPTPEVDHVDATNHIAAATKPPPSKPESAIKSSGKPNYWSLLEVAIKSIASKDWEAAKAPLLKLVELYPDQNGPDNVYAMLAIVHRGLNETAAERATLEKWAASEADVNDAYLRAMELAEVAQDWRAVVQNAERFIAVNPLLPQPYRFLSRASEALGETAPAITAYQKLLLLDPPDPADVHFRLATLLHKKNDPAAKRHVMQALEEAPRFREAHRLFLELAQAHDSPTNSVITP